MRLCAAIMAAFVATAQLMACGKAAAPSGRIFAQPPLPQEPLTIHTRSGVVCFSVEVALTPEQQEAGLMFRRSVAPFGGMIFKIKPARSVTFWMKNTVVALDMLFIRPDGTIARITTARPLDESLDPSGEPVAAVLEIGAGRARALGIKEGDRVRWRGLGAAGSVRDKPNARLNAGL